VGLRTMRRRDVIMLIGGAAAARPFAARAQQPFATGAQQPTMPVVGVLNRSVPKQSIELVYAFRQGLSHVGYTENRNVLVGYHYAWGKDDQLPEIAADLVQRQVAVIATAGVPEALAAKAATTTIPVVFTIEGDPIATGLVPTLNRPGGNVTGVAIVKMEVGPKRLELLHQVVPTASAVALLVNPTNPAAAEPLVSDAQATARSLGLQLHVLKASVDGEIDAAFAALPGLQAGGLVIGSDQFFDSRGLKLGALALQYSVPAIYQQRAFIAAGGLIGYGVSITDAFQVAGAYTGRILNGEKPADLPVHQSTKVELLINTKTAKALGINIPPALLERADVTIDFSL
jgi:putative tryptophan/tyrosine transport system substrate-binding protein